MIVAPQARTPGPGLAWLVWLFLGCSPVIVAGPREPEHPDFSTLAERALESIRLDAVVERSLEGWMEPLPEELFYIDPDVKRRWLDWRALRKGLTACLGAALVPKAEAVQKAPDLGELVRYAGTDAPLGRTRAARHAAANVVSEYEPCPALLRGPAPGVRRRAPAEAHRWVEDKLEIVNELRVLLGDGHARAEASRSALEAARAAIDEQAGRQRAYYQEQVARGIPAERWHSLQERRFQALRDEVAAAEDRAPSSPPAANPQIEALARALERFGR